MNKPTIPEIAEFCKERGNNIDPEQFYYYYESKGWVIGKSPMKSWQACVRTWERNSTHSMAIKGRDEAYKKQKQVYTLPVKKKPAHTNPEITKLRAELFSLGNMRGFTASQRIVAKTKMRDIKNKIQVIQDNDCKIGSVI
jgi:hypothetical protein